MIRGSMRVQILSSIVLAATGPAAAQPAPSPIAAEFENLSQETLQFQARVDEAARHLDQHPRLKNLNQEQRKELVEFVTGNMLFALLHELGHAHIQEMGLSVLGREEDAADSYAITTMLKVGTAMSDRVLVQATKGWFLSAERGQKEGSSVAYYDEHGFDQQRAYQIVCVMVGSDPQKFADLAGQFKMPEARQQSCMGDYSNAVWSWETALKPHLRAPDQPRQQITVSYGPAGEHAVLAQALRAIGMLEMLADYEADRFVWRRPIAFDVRACGRPDLHWDLSTQKVLVCYEMQQDFANLYRDYGLKPEANAGQK